MIRNLAATLSLLLVVPAVWALPAAPESEGDPQEQGTPVIDTRDLGLFDELLYPEERELEVPLYDAGARRDPFVPLRLTLPTGESRSCPGEGVAALLIDDLEIEGVYATEEGSVVQAMSSLESTSYLLRAGDQLCDGDVVAVTPESVEFRQEIDDPTSPKPWRPVIKRLQ